MTDSELAIKANELSTLACNWLEDSGLAVNKQKSELVTFSKKGAMQLTVQLGDTKISSSNTMKVFLIIFDSKLNWAPYVEETISKSLKSCYGLRHLAKNIPQVNMMQLATAFSYSRLYYGANVWLGPMLAKPQWKRILATSVSIIKSALSLQGWTLSYKDLHEVAGRAPPSKMSIYLAATTLKKIIDHQKPTLIYKQWQNNMSVNTRLDRQFVKVNNRTRYGSNSFLNRICEVLKIIPLSWMDDNIALFKVKCKKLILKA